MGSYAGGSPGNCPVCPCVKTSLVLGYYHVGSSCLWVSLHNKCETSNSYYRAMTRSGMKPCEQISNYFQFWLTILYIMNVYQNRGSCSASKRRYTRVLALGSYKGEGTRVVRSHPFFVSKFCFFYFENIISPSKCTTRCWNWLTVPLAANICCCLTRYSFVFMLGRQHKSYRYIVLASKGNPMVEIGLFWIKPPWLWCLQTTFKYIFPLLSCRLFLRFFMLYFVTAIDKKGPDAALPIFHCGYQRYCIRFMTK